MHLIDDLKWRYATKKYDASKKVSQENIDRIKKAVQLSASSYGLQPYKVLEIKDPELREALKPIAWNQSQITDASHLFVFCNYLNVSEENVAHMLQLNAEINGVDLEQLAGYGDFMNAKMKEKSSDEMENWTAKQTYIALSNALDACAELKIDSTPIEGFEPEAVNEKLGLRKKGLSAAVILAVGYRHEEDATQHGKKVRKSMETLFEAV